MKKVLICGAGGFIGGHLVKALLKKNYEVVAIDIKHFDNWYQIDARANNVDNFDLRKQVRVNGLFANNEFDEIYQLAADMGGAGFIFTGDHDADIMQNSALVNLNITYAISKFYSHPTKVKVFYSSSACVYPQRNQLDPNNPKCSEDSAYPAEPDSEYGWEKLFSERLWSSYSRNYGIPVRIARFHNIFGPNGAWEGGREKAPAALCRKVVQTKDGGELEIWGSGGQTRSFLYIDECVEGISRLMDSEVTDILNLGSDEMISINGLAHMIMEIAGKKLFIKNVSGPEGVRGRNSDNRLIYEKLGWAPNASLREGITKTYSWIEDQVNSKKSGTLKL